MADEFDKIMKFFELPAEEKQARLKDVFEESIEFFEKYKHFLQTGTEEEKKSMMVKMRTLQTRLKEETSKIVQATGLSEDDLKAFASDPKNYDKGEWETIQTAKTRIESQAKDIKKMTKGPDADKPKKASSGKRKKNWMKS